MSDAVLPGDIESPLKTEKVENWTFVGANGVTSSYCIRVERGEKVDVVLNAIDHTPVLVQVQLKDGTEKNETVAKGAFIVANLLSFFKEDSTAVIYPKGESPEEKELVRVAELRAKRAEAFEKRQAALEADFLREMAEQGQ